jgi:hypothetical protein
LGRAPLGTSPLTPYRPLRTLATTVAWSKSTEFGWIQFVKGPQDAIIAAEAWIGSFAFWAWFQDENPPLTA